MDVRFFWLRDRVKKAQFYMQHLKGKYNIADFFTKPLPKEKFEQFTPYIIVQAEKTHVKTVRRTVVLNKKL